MCIHGNIIIRDLADLTDIDKLNKTSVSFFETSIQICNISPYIYIHELSSSSGKKPMRILLTSIHW
ncbi:MAG: hypothetical protein EAZ77_09390 [Nostocales cyanobacterium]|nr:MAG: hypothetical protein EAZ77_09390 [Nostocales cyanobacterium]